METDQYINDEINIVNNNIENKLEFLEYDDPLSS